MSFFRRLVFYLFGVSLGVGLSSAFFSDRPYTCNYLPNDRVLSHLRSGQLTFSEEALLSFNTLNIDTNDVFHLLQDGRVNFSKSNKEQKIYEINSSVISANFQLKKDTTLLINLW